MRVTRFGLFGMLDLTSGPGPWVEAGKDWERGQDVSSALSSLGALLPPCLLLPETQIPARQNKR